MELYFQEDNRRAVRFIRYLEKMGIEILDEDIDPELYRNIPMVITVGCPVWKEFGCVIGQTFRFPRRYKDMVQPGRPFVYYQCTSLRDGGEKLRGYFGTGIIGEVDKDRRGKNKFTGSKYTASIRDYRPFERIVYWTDGKFPIEGDLEDRDWLELVRDISKDTFARILRYEQNPVITEPPLIGIGPEYEENLREFNKLLRKFGIEDVVIETHSAAALSLPEIEEVVPVALDAPNAGKVGSNDQSLQEIEENFQDHVSTETLGKPIPQIVVMPDINEVRPSRAETSFLVAAAKARTNELSGGQKKGTAPVQYRRSRNSTIIGNRAEEVVFRLLQAVASTKGYQSVRWVSREGEKPGWDIEIVDVDGLLHAVEVKGSSGKVFSSVEVTAQEWQAAEELRSRYALFLVTECTGKNPKIQQIKNPFSLAESGTFVLSPLVWRIEYVPPKE
jgi:hypothetical protein